jgi:proteasome lid subunit RPN8/RPN11
MRPPAACLGTSCSKRRSESVSGRVLHLAPDLAGIVIAAARRAYPLECCGLIEGIDTPDGWRALALHETANRAPDPARHFLVDPQVQFALIRALRDSGKRIIGCFHSHPNGRDEPSDTDRESAAEDDFVWLIAAGESANGFALGAFAFETGNMIFRKVSLAD